MTTLTVFHEPLRRGFCPILLVSAVSLLLTACEGSKKSTGREVIDNTTAQASVDWANDHEAGNSSINYDGVSRQNVIVYSEINGDDDNESWNEDAAGDYEDYVGKKGPNPYWGFKFGLEYIGKGAKFPFAGSNNTIPLNYLELPLDLRYHYPLGPGYLHGGVGPYFAYGVGGSVDGISVYGENNGGFKRFDAGLNFQVGYNFHGVVLDLSYDLGLANIEYASQDVKGHNRVFSINFGYQIGRLFKK